MRIDGHTEVIAHLGWPTHSFKAPLIYNPYFEAAGINAVVVPMACRAGELAGLLPALFRLDNLRGALVTMPHKQAVLELLDAVTPAVEIAGACNAVRRLPDGRLLGDQFDGEGFVRGARARGFEPRGARALIVGCGGVGSAIAAALAAAQPAGIVLHDQRADAAEALAGRLRRHHPQLAVRAGGNDPAGFDLVVNCTPLGMQPGDALPLPAERLDARCFVGEVVLSQAMTPLLRAAQARGCRVQVGTDMLFEMIPAYLEFFGLPVATAQRLRELARL